MFKRLAKLFGQKPERQDLSLHSATNSVPSMMTKVINADQPKLEIKDALGRFMHMVTAHLNAPENRRLSEAVLACWDADGDASNAFADGVLSENGQKRGQWLVIQVDWKADDEIEWQIAEVASNFGITDQWTWSECDPDSRTVMAGLSEVSRWAAPLGYELLHLDLGDDAYYALMVPSAKAEMARQVALSAELKAFRQDAFAEREA